MSRWYKSAELYGVVAVVALTGAIAVGRTAGCSGDLWRSGTAASSSVTPPPFGSAGQLPRKIEVARAILGAAGGTEEAATNAASLFVHLDPRKPDVRVPSQFRTETRLVLQVGYHLALPIPDLALEHEGIRGTLSFGGKPFFCSVPWRAIYALVGEDGRGMVWPDDVPAEVRAEMDAGAPQGPSR